jgi:V-type H+-transporting ATPase subunit E
VAFIKQEALEKAREIRVKADEEFAIEKVPLIASLETCCLTS